MKDDIIRHIIHFWFFATELQSQLLQVGKTDFTAADGNGYEILKHACNIDKCISFDGVRRRWIYI